MSVTSSSMCLAKPRAAAFGFDHGGLVTAGGTVRSDSEGRAARRSSASFLKPDCYIERDVASRSAAEISMSKRMVAMVQTVFAVVLGQSVFHLSDVILHPLNYLVGTVALLSVYVTTIWSWMDWHYTAGRYPYLARDEEIGRLEQLRILPDVLIVVAYAYLVLTIPVPSPGPSASAYGSTNMTAHLLGYPLVFALYALAGRWRQAVYGQVASTQAATVMGLASMLWILGTYRLAAPLSYTVAGNVLALSAVIATTLLYRLGWRPLFKGILLKRLRLDFRVGVDIDGVLGNQIEGIRKRVEQRYGYKFEYEDVRSWDEPLGAQTDVKREIEGALYDCEYVLNMPVHVGASEATQRLKDLGASVVVVTARPPVCGDTTLEWLRTSDIRFDEVIHVDPGRKTLDALDVLVDDYPGNILPFLLHSSKPAILVDQPWNRSAQGGSLAEWIDAGRLWVADGIAEVPGIVETLRSR